MLSRDITTYHVVLILHLDVKRGGSPTDIFSEKGAEMDIHRAARLGNVKKMQKLLRQPGIDVNQVSEDGFTPLILAIQKGHEKVAEMLLKQECIQVNKASVNGLTPLIIAINMAQKGYLQLTRGTMVW